MEQLNALRQTIGSFLGQVVTPEMAVAIELSAIAAALPHDPINPLKFGSVEKNGYMIQAERFADILSEIHPLHLAHWQETERHRHGLMMIPDYKSLLDDERAGKLIQFTVRKDGELVGNLRIYLGKSRHTSSKFATEDTLYLKPEHRGGMTAIALMRFAEGALLSIGVREIRADSKLINNADVLMRRMKYEAVAIKFVKIFKESSDVC